MYIAAYEGSVVQPSLSKERAAQALYSHIIASSRPVQVHVSVPQHCKLHACSAVVGDDVQLDGAPSACGITNNNKNATLTCNTKKFESFRDAAVMVGVEIVRSFDGNNVYENWCMK